jgi:putative oxidoreductase
MKSELLNNVVVTNRLSWAPLALRIGLGVVVIAHGAQKLFGWWGGPGLSGTAQFFGGTLGLEPRTLLAVLSGCAEFFGGVLVLLGLFTRPAALAVAINLLVAIIVVHRGAFFTQHGGMEFPLALFCVAVALMFTGGGRLSADASLQS